MNIEKVKNLAEREFDNQPDYVDEIVGGVMNKTLFLVIP